MPLINPREAISQGWITSPIFKTMNDWERNVQQAGIDFPLTEVRTFNSCSDFRLTEDSTTHIETDILTPKQDLNDGSYYWTLAPRHAYSCCSDFRVNLPADVASLLIVRSSLNRNGLFITTGLYDPGFHNTIGFTLHNRVGFADISTGVRVGQIIFMPADSAKEYIGNYND